jgi:hypothetical protein
MERFSPKLRTNSNPSKWLLVQTKTVTTPVRMNEHDIESYRNASYILRAAMAHLRSGTSASSHLLVRVFGAARFVVLISLSLSTTRAPELHTIAVNLQVSSLIHGPPTINLACHNVVPFQCEQTSSASESES